jgi:hypothetical protein
LLLRLKARILEAGICEHRIDRLNLVLIDERTKQSVPHHEYVVRGLSRLTTPVQIAHDRPVIPVQHFDLNAGAPLKAPDRAGFGKAIQKPGVTSHTNRHGLAFLATRHQQDRDKQCCE